MIRFEEHKNDPIFYALLKLDDAMSEHNCAPITLNVVGGFALMIHEDRTASEYTDIDFVGLQLPRQVKQLADEVGQQTGMVKDWLNNDMMLAGATLEDLEFSTGPLNFIPAYQLDNICINVLDEPDLLRLKLIAIDTAMVELENHTDFTRFKDLRDIAALLNKLDLTPAQAIHNNQEYLINENTQTLIQAYLDNHGDVVKTLQQIQDKLDYAQYQQLKTKFEPAEHSLLDDRGISGMLDDLFSR